MRLSLLGANDSKSGFTRNTPWPVPGLWFNSNAIRTDAFRFCRRSIVIIFVIFFSLQFEQIVRHHSLAHALRHPQNAKPYRQHCLCVQNHLNRIAEETKMEIPSENSFVLVVARLYDHPSLTLVHFVFYFIFATIQCIPWRWTCGVVCVLWTMSQRNIALFVVQLWLVNNVMAVYESNTHTHSRKRRMRERQRERMRKRELEYCFSFIMFACFIFALLLVSSLGARAHTRHLILFRLCWHSPRLASYVRAHTWHMRHEYTMYDQTNKNAFTAVCLLPIHRRLSRSLATRLFLMNDET